MKKSSKLLSLAMVVVALVGCSLKKDNIIEYNLNHSENVIESNNTTLTLTTKEIYDYIRQNETTQVNTVFLKHLMEQVLNIQPGSSEEEMYNIKVTKHFTKEYIENEKYQVNGIFNEDLLVAKLESDLYVVDKVNKPTSGPTHSLGLEYNYSDYIERALNYNVYLEMLKTKYILTEKKSIIDDSKTRIISIYSDTDLEDTMELVKELNEGKYDDLTDLTRSKKDLEIEELGRQLCKELGEKNDYYTPKEGEGDCSPTTNNSTYDKTLKTFTTCENNMRCDIEDGIKYQIELIEKKQYIETKVINKHTTGILYDGALKQLLRDNVEDYLHDIIEGEDPFLSDWLYNNSPEYSQRDIILTAGAGSTNYLVTVRVVDSNTNNVVDLEEAISLLLDRVSDTTVLTYYLENVDVQVDDPQIQEYYNKLIGK